MSISDHKAHVYQHESFNIYRQKLDELYKCRIILIKKGEEKWKMVQFDVNVVVKKRNSLIQLAILLVTLSTITGVMTAYGKARLLNLGEALRREKTAVRHYDKPLFFIQPYQAN